MLAAEARRIASAKRRISIRWSFTGAQVDWTIKQSDPRTDSPRETEVSPVAEGGDPALSQREPQLLCNLPGQLRVGASRKNLDVLSMQVHIQTPFPGRGPVFLCFPKGGSPPALPILLFLL